MNLISNHNVSQVLCESIGSSLYVVVEHRNHIEVMSPTTVSVNADMFTYDFRGGERRQMRDKEIRISHPLFEQCLLQFRVLHKKD